MPDSDLSELVRAAGRGERAARDRLIEMSGDRLKTIARSMLNQFPQVRRWEETDDVWQSSMLRLWKSLERCPLESPRHFFNLAALQIRRELIELARHYGGPHGLGRNHATPPPQREEETTPAPKDDTLEASKLAVWTELHEQIEALPEADREVFGLLWYHGLPQGEAAHLLGISVRTVKRRWQAARLRLHDKIERFEL